MPRKTQEAKFQPSGDVQRITSLNQATWAYVSDEHGKTHHLKRSSIAMAETCNSVDKALNGKIRLELERLGWHDVISRMDSLEAQDD